MIASGEGVSAEVRVQDDRLVLQLATPLRRYPEMALALRGRHQVQNAIVAVRLLEALAPGGRALDEQAVVSAVATARWPGRLDLRSQPDGKRVLLDAAHNPAGAAVLAAYLREFHPGRLPIVFGIMKDKDASGTLAPLLPLAAPLILTRPHTDRALDLAALDHAARHLGAATVLVAPDPRSALERAWTFAPLACAAGSIFLVGDILADLERPAAERSNPLC
jgi:dihydrofolate synthase/folylpolyglutamate synthase